MTARVFLPTCLLVLLGVACRRPSVEPAASPAASPVAPAPMAASASRRKPADPSLEAAPAAAAAAQRGKDEEDLQSEEREANPLSETVTLTLTISPPVKALVMWGSKQFARVASDSPTVELQRPRNTGPLDLDIRAEGFLPHHTRLYTDRNDKVNVRLVRPADATGLLGYRAPALVPIETKQPR